MITRVIIACLLLMVTVAIHSIGFSVLLRAMLRSHALDTWAFRPVTWWLFVLTCWLLLIHLAEMAIWGLFYLWQGLMPDAGTGVYFSAVTYTGLGDGELVLPKPWRMFAPLEAMTGILMGGLSTGLFFALVSRWISNWMKRHPEKEPHTAASVDNVRGQIRR
jgi:hypothetical protein